MSKELIFVYGLALFFIAMGLVGLFVIELEGADPHLHYFLSGVSFMFGVSMFSEIGYTKQTIKKEAEIIRLKKELRNV
jgi:hypothetical protein